MELDNNPSLRPHEQEPEQKFPTGTIDQLNVRELSATTVNAQTVQAEEVKASSGDIDKLKLHPLFTDMNRDLNLLVLDDEKQVHRTTVEELTYVLNDDYDFISQDKLTAELNNYTKNNKTNSTITNFNDCPVGFVSMPENSTNAPSASRCYVLTQFYNNNVNFKSQIATVINSNEVYVRNYNNGTWNVWQKLTTESDLSNYVPKEKKQDGNKTRTFTLESGVYLLTALRNGYNTNNNHCEIIFFNGYSTEETVLKQGTNITTSITIDSTSQATLNITFDTTWNPCSLVKIS